MPPRRVEPARRPLTGAPAIPGDKSISHRAAILGTLAEGETHITGFLTAEDCLNTLKACGQLGAKVRRQGTEVWIEGGGLRGVKKPAEVIDCGNSGTGTRLLAGVLAGQPFESVITGDEQVRRRPMKRIIEPLTRMGAAIDSKPGGLCPLRVRGGNLKGIEYVSPVASAQVKSCVLLAGLFAEGKTSVRLPLGSRRHTENMLKYLGVPLEERQEEKEEIIAVKGGARFAAKPVQVPADISSAAFFITAAALIPDSQIVLKGVGHGLGRDQLLFALIQYMQADIKLSNGREISGEEITDIAVRGSRRLQGTRMIAGAIIPGLIDEIPILAVTAALAEGDTEIRDAAELRAKETDRISVLVGELRKIGVDVEELPDGMVIHGGTIRGGETDSHGDHRLAMSLAVAGLVSREGVTVHNPECVNTSFPGFWELLDKLTL